MIIINRDRPIRFKDKGLIIIILPEPRNDYDHNSDYRAEGEVRKTAFPDNPDKMKSIFSCLGQNLITQECASC